MTIVPVSIKYNLREENGGNKLDAYDAGVALSGISRSLAISIHYFINESVIKQAPSLEGAKIELRLPRPGSFIFDVDIAIITTTALSIASGVVGNACWDYLKYIFSRTTGRDYSPTNPDIAQLTTRNEGAIDAIVDTIESDVAAIHRPIIHNAQNVIIFSGDKNIINFDNRSYEYVKAKNISKSTDRFHGNVSSFNANSGKGRFYLTDHERTIPFSFDEEELDHSQKSRLAWSLNEYVNGRQGLLHIEALHVSTPNGFLKALIVKNVERL